MDDIAGFLLDNALKLGETVLQAAAPAINKAIEASNDLISSHTLDLAKALDLSGALIPGNPLAFAPALKLAKSLATVIPGSEDKGVIDTIERLDQQVAPFTKRAEDVLQQMDAVIKTGELLEKETHDKVHAAAIGAYQALADAVGGLLAITESNRAIKRVAPDVLSKLDVAVERFRDLSTAGKTNAWKLGKDAAILTSFSETTKNFNSTLNQEKEKLIQQLRNNGEARARHKNHLDTLKKSEFDLEERRQNAIREIEGGWFAFIFTPSARKNWERIKSEAEDGLYKNRISQRDFDNKIRVLYLLDTLVGWALRALDVVIQSVARIAQDFQVKYARILHAQEVSGQLEAGLLDLGNKIDVTELRMTRDHSLRVVMEVLRLYHGLRIKHAALQIPGIEEYRIHKNIVEKLGEDGVKALLQPPAPVQDGDDVVNSM